MVCRVEVNLHKDKELYKMKRRSDDKLFLMKLIKDCEQSDMAKVINEASLMAYL